MRGLDCSGYRIQQRKSDLSYLILSLVWMIKIDVTRSLPLQRDLPLLADTNAPRMRPYERVIRSKIASLKKIQPHWPALVHAEYEPCSCGTKGGFYGGGNLVGPQLVVNSPVTPWEILGQNLSKLFSENSGVILNASSVRNCIPHMIILLLGNRRGFHLHLPLVESRIMHPPGRPSHLWH